MMRAINRFIFKMLGWTIDENVPPEANRCVLTAVPHTSNWDFFIVNMAFSILRIPMKFTIKDDWMKFPFNLIIKPLGGIGIDRSPKQAGEKRLSLVEAMANLFKEHEQLAMVVTPEGTRSKATKWKTGFYYTAVTAGVPICLSYCDFSMKKAGIGKVIYPSGDIEKDMREITRFYKDFKGRHPEKFSVDLRYLDEDSEG